METLPQRTRSRARWNRPVTASLAHGLKIVSLAFAALVAFESLAPSGAVQSINHMDKLVHFCVYAVLAFLLIGAWHRSSLLFIFIVAAFYGALLEVGQGMMQLGRTASLADQVANMSGAFVAVLLWMRIIKALKSSRRGLKATARQ